MLLKTSLSAHVFVKQIKPVHTDAAACANTAALNSTELDIKTEHKGKAVPRRTEARRTPRARCDSASRCRAPSLADLVLQAKNINVLKMHPSPNRLYSTSFVKTNALGGLLSSRTAVLTDFLEKNTTKSTRSC